jgi:hypothetical protein
MHGPLHRTQKIKEKKIHALSLAEECYSMKLDMLANATVVDDAIRFVSQKLKNERISLLVRANLIIEKMIWERLSLYG